MPAFRMSYTDRSGTTHPDAIVVYSKLRLQTDPSYCEMQLTAFHNEATYASTLEPVDPPRLITFTAVEMEGIQAQFGTVPYVVLRGRPEFAMAEIVPLESDPVE